jgi:hypothetical protein
VRTFAVISAVTVAVVLPLLAAPAMADAPAAWGEMPHESALRYLLVLLIIPGGIAILIAVLVSRPSLMHGESYRPGEAWVAQDEWFGGPRKGVEAADQLEAPSGERGGAGADF